MWRRSVRSLGLALAAAAILAGPVLAGGWAMTVFDPWPEGGFRAGETYRLGYTIRQHGVRPVDGATTVISVRQPSGREIYGFTGVADGPGGHYVAEVRFPAGGEWVMEVSQEPFEPQKVGTISVLPAPAVGAAPAANEIQAAALVPVALSSLLVVAGVFLLWLLVATGRRAPVVKAG